MLLGRRLKIKLLPHLALIACIINNNLDCHVAQDVPIPDDVPTFTQINNAFVFSRDEDLYPIVNVVHIRTTVNLDGLRNLSAIMCAYTQDSYEMGHYDTPTRYITKDNKRLPVYREWVPAAIATSLDNGNHPSSAASNTKLK